MLCEVIGVHARLMVLNLHDVLLIAQVVTLVCINSGVEASSLYLDQPQPWTSVALRREIDRAIDVKARRRLLQENVSQDSTDMTVPIYHMLGSYFAYLWVGSPPQRVSVIMDTGSHYTAFPCSGCNCGSHMDPYFDPKTSKTSVVSKCFRDHGVISSSLTARGAAGTRTKSRTWSGWGMPETHKRPRRRYK